MKLADFCCNAFAPPYMHFHTAVLSHAITRHFTIHMTLTSCWRAAGGCAEGADGGDLAALVQLRRMKNSNT